MTLTLASARCLIWRSGYAPRISINAAPLSMRYMRRRSSASARGNPRALRVRLQGQYRNPRDVPKGGQFVLHAKALHGNPFDGHTLGPVVADMEKLTGVEARRIHLDKGVPRP